MLQSTSPMWCYCNEIAATESASAFRIFTIFSHLNNRVGYILSNCY